MNLRDLTYLVTVAEHLHFGKAARACNISQPTLSMQLKKLEQEIGSQLFERTNKSVLLTPIGRDIAQRGAPSAGRGRADSPDRPQRCRSAHRRFAHGRLPDPGALSAADAGAEHEKGLPCPQPAAGRGQDRRSGSTAGRRPAGLRIVGDASYQRSPERGGSIPRGFFLAVPASHPLASANPSRRRNWRI